MHMISKISCKYIDFDYKLLNTSMTFFSSATRKVDWWKDNGIMSTQSRWWQLEPLILTDIHRCVYMMIFNLRNNNIVDIVQWQKTTTKKTRNVTNYRIHRSTISPFTGSLFSQFPQRTQTQTLIDKECIHWSAVCDMWRHCLPTKKPIQSCKLWWANPLSSNLAGWGWEQD